MEGRGPDHLLPAGHRPGLRAFNEERSRFYTEQSLDPLPASTGVQALLCRPDLLVQIEVIAIFLKHI